MKKELKIGNVKFDNPFFLAPMAGITDAPMRLICKEQGASLVCSEMISGKGLLYQDRSTKKLLHTYDEEDKVAFQIFGREPNVIADTAKKLNEYPNQILDLNAGCPVPKVVKNGEGSSLMREPELVYDLIKAMVKESKKPVTIKIRLGWDKNNINCVEVAKAAEAAGASAVAVHGRTREDFYQGKADWNEISRVKEAVNIPVIGNGDVRDWDSAKALMETSGCDFVMVGRGALGNPWIFRELVAGWRGNEIPKRPSFEEKNKMIIRHLNLLRDLKGENVAIREMRKHIGWYIKGIKGAAKLRGKVNQIDNYQELLNLIKQCY